MCPDVNKRMIVYSYLGPKCQYSRHEQSLCIDFKLKTFYLLTSKSTSHLSYTYRVHSVSVVVAVVNNNQSHSRTISYFLSTNGGSVCVNIVLFTTKYHKYFTTIIRLVRAQRQMKVRVSIIICIYLRVQKRCGKYNRTE